MDVYNYLRAEKGHTSETKDKGIKLLAHGQVKYIVLGATYKVAFLF